MFHRVVFERDPRIAALLRTPMHLAVFADVQIARARSTTPFVRLAFSDTVLKPIKPRVILVAEFLDRVKYFFFFLRQWLQRSIFIMNHTDGGGEAKFDRAPGNG